MEHVFGCTNRSASRRMIRQFDKNGNGEIDFAEFVGMMAFDSGDGLGLNSLLKSQLVGYREAFNLFDRDNDGNVTADDLIATFKLLAIKVDDDTVVSMVESADTDGSGELQFPEFVLVLSAARNQTGGKVRLDKISELREMWAYFDQDGSGSITEDEIAVVLISLGTDPEAAPVTAHDMMLAADAGGDGQIEFEEFVKIMCLARKEDDPEDDPLFGSAANVDVLELLMAQLGPPTAPKVAVPVSKATRLLKKKQNKEQELSPVETRTKELELMRTQIAKAYLDGEHGTAAQMEHRTVKAEQMLTAMANKVLNVLKEHLQLEHFRKLPPKEANALCCHVKLHKHPPGKILVHEGRPVAGWNFLLKGNAIMRKMPTNDRREDTRRVAMWIDLKDPSDQLLYALQRAMSSLPSKDKVGLSSNAKVMLEKLDESQLGCSTWIRQAKQTLSNDMDNLHRFPWLIKQGRIHVISLQELAILVPAVRKEYLLVKACTQLSSTGDKRMQIYEASSVLTTLKMLAGALERGLNCLEPVFTPESVVDEDALLQLERFNHQDLGRALLELQPNRGFGEIVFQPTKLGNDEICSPVSVACSPETEVICLYVSRDAFRLSMVIEEASFLSTMPAFRELQLVQLQKLCLHVEKRELAFGQTFMLAGAPANSIFVVKSGTIDIRVYLEQSGEKPEADTSASSSETKMHSVAIVGKGDILNETKDVDGRKVYLYNAVCLQNGSVVFQIDRRAMSKLVNPLTGKPFELVQDIAKLTHRTERARRLQSATDTAAALLDADHQMAKDALQQMVLAGCSSSGRARSCLPPVEDHTIKGTMERRRELVCSRASQVIVDSRARHTQCFKTELDSSKARRHL